MALRKVKLKRYESSDSGTFGLLSTGALFQCYIGELPWRNNEKGKSCVPAGIYRFVRVNSPKHGKCYEMLDDPTTAAREDAPGRDHIQIHSANFMGDAEKGLKCQLLGCMAPGRAVGDMMGQKAVLSSKDAMAAFETEMNNEPFEMEVSWEDAINQEKK